jgi:elongation factor Ts
MAITTEQIKELRDRTGVSVMQCKKALKKQMEILKKLSYFKTEKQRHRLKKADRTFGAGAIASYIHSSGTLGAMVELVSETDFVSKNEEFKTLLEILLCTSLHRIPNI